MGKSGSIIKIIRLNSLLRITLEKNHCSCLENCNNNDFSRNILKPYP